MNSILPIPFSASEDVSDRFSLLDEVGVDIGYSNEEEKLRAAATNLGNAFVGEWTETAATNSLNVIDGQCMDGEAITMRAGNWEGGTPMPVFENRFRVDGHTLSHYLVPARLEQIHQITGISDGMIDAAPVIRRADVLSMRLNVPLTNHRLERNASIQFWYTAADSITRQLAHRDVAGVIINRDRIRQQTASIPGNILVALDENYVDDLAGGRTAAVRVAVHNVLSAFGDRWARAASPAIDAGTLVSGTIRTAAERAVDDVDAEEVFVFNARLQDETTGETACEVLAAVPPMRIDSFVAELNRVFTAEE